MTREKEEGRVHQGVNGMREGRKAGMRCGGSSSQKEVQTAKRKGKKIRRGMNAR
jgi:hypothetical protein